MDLKKFLTNIPTKELYNDLFSPGMKKAGEALETVIDGANLILLPLKLLSSKSRIYFKANLDRYSAKVNANTKLTLTKVPQYVGLPIIDKLIYLDQNELAEAFINLLTKASFDETLKLVHPTYITILSNLSADEAKILFHFKNNLRIPFIDYYIHRYVEKIKKPEFLDKTVKSRIEIKEMIDFRFQNREDVYLRSAWNLTGIEKFVELDFPENIDIYLENLNKSGIIEFERDLQSSEDKNIYEDLALQYSEIREIIEDSSKELESQGYLVKINTRRGYIEFTEIGRGFLNACIKEIEQ